MSKWLAVAALCCLAMSGGTCGQTRGQISQWNLNLHPETVTDAQSYTALFLDIHNWLVTKPSVADTLLRGQQFSPEGITKVEAAVTQWWRDWQGCEDAWKAGGYKNERAHHDQMNQITLDAAKKLEAHGVKFHGYIQAQKNVMNPPAFSQTGDQHERKLRLAYDSFFLDDLLLNAT
jgi:hypothetical protein